MKPIEFTPEHLKLWTRPSYYFGAEWPDYYSAGVGQSRDSDALERANFDAMLKALGGEQTSEDELDLKVYDPAGLEMENAAGER